MFAGLQTTLSALIASSVRFNTAASNIVNAGVKSTPGKATASGPVFRAGYTPQRVIQTTTGSGGVRASIVPVSPASLSVFDPTSPLGNEKGLVNIPNVSLPVEIAELQKASIAYKANARMLKTLDATFRTILKI